MKKLLCIINLVVLIITGNIICCNAFDPDVPTDNHLYYIKNVCSDKYLTVNGSNIEQYDLAYYSTQRFFVRYAKTANGYYYYTLVPDCNNEYRVSVANANDSNGANIYIDLNNTSNSDFQHFRFVSNGNKVYQIMPEISTTRVFDVVNASVNNGANIGLYTQRTTSDSLVGAQQWKLYTVEQSILGYDLVDNSKHLDYDCDSAFSSYAVQAKDTWNGYKSGVIRKYLPLIRAKDVDIIGVTHLSGGAVGMTVFSSGEIQVNTNTWTDFSDDVRTNLLTHEIGHALGMGHLDDTSNVLYYAVNSTTTLKQTNKGSYNAAYANY